MANLNGFITNFVAGDNLEIRRTITDLTGPAVTAWLTIKRHRFDADEDAIVQKEITIASTAGGVIAVDGSGSPPVDAEVVFFLTPADTLLCRIGRYYDIQVQTDDDKLSTPEVGRIRGVRQVTIATSAG